MTDDNLKYDAGIAQLTSDKNVSKWFNNILNGNFGDNVGDAKMIQDGLKDYYSKHPSARLEKVLKWIY